VGTTASNRRLQLTFHNQIDCIRRTGQIKGLIFEFVNFEYTLSCGERIGSTSGGIELAGQDRGLNHLTVGHPDVLVALLAAEGFERGVNQSSAKELG